MASSLKRIESILSVMSKQTILVISHALITFFFLIALSIILNSTHTFWIRTVSAALRSFVIYLMFPCANQTYDCVCYIMHNFCVKNILRIQTPNLNQSNTQVHLHDTIRRQPTQETLVKSIAIMPRQQSIMDYDYPESQLMREN